MQYGGPCIQLLRFHFYLGTLPPNDESSLIVPDSTTPSRSSVPGPGRPAPPGRKGQWGARAIGALEASRARRGTWATRGTRDQRGRGALQDLGARGAGVGERGNWGGQVRREGERGRGQVKC